MTLFVDPDALDGIVSMLDSSGSTLDAAGESIPGTLDAGDATPALLGVMARLSENAGQLVVALAAASEAVGEANARYREQTSRPPTRSAPRGRNRPCPSTPA